MREKKILCCVINLNPSTVLLCAYFFLFFSFCFENFLRFFSPFLHINFVSDPKWNQNIQKSAIHINIFVSDAILLNLWNAHATKRTTKYKTKQKIKSKTKFNEVSHDKIKYERKKIKSGSLFRVFLSMVRRCKWTCYCCYSCYARLQRDGFR